MYSSKNQVTVFGANTNVGSYVLYLLSKLGYVCVVPLFHPHRYDYLKFNSNVQLVQTNMLKTNEISSSMQDSHTVFNFFRAYENTTYDLDQLDSYNHFYCKHLVQLCVKNKVRHLIHHSTLGISQLILNNPYWLSRSYGEKALLSNSTIQLSIVQSGWFYGEGVSLNDAASCFVKHISQDLQRKKFYPLIGKNVILSPIHIKELAKLFVSLMKNKHTRKRRIGAVGKDTLTLDEIVEKIHSSINSSTKLYRYPQLLASRLVKKNKACGAFFPIGTKDFKLSLTASETTIARNQQTIYQSDQGIIDYIETNSHSLALNEQFTTYRKFSKR